MAKDREGLPPPNPEDDARNREAKVVPFQPRTQRPNDPGPTPPDDDKPLPPVA